MSWSTSWRYALGGRTAEEIVFGDPSTGASNDIEKATALARKMVMEYGMSDRLGPLKYGSPEGEVFLGRDYTQGQDLSNEVAAAIDDEVRSLITQAHEEATEIIATHRDALDRIAEQLKERETLDAEGVAEVLYDVPKWEHSDTGALRLKGPDKAGSQPGIAAAQTGSHPRSEAEFARSQSPVPVASKEWRLADGSWLMAHGS